jgi:hypothetical protein
MGGVLWRPGFRAAWHGHEWNAVTGRQRGGWRGEHHDGWSGEVIGHRNGGVVEQTSCLLDRSAAQAQEDSVRSSGRPTGSIIE